MPQKISDYRRIYGLATRIWGHSDANDELHSLTYREFGKESLKDLTVREVERLISLLNSVENNPSTMDVDVDQIMAVLLDNLSHETFSVLVDRVIDWRRLCGYQSPLSFKQKPCKLRRPDPNQPGIFS